MIFNSNPSAGTSRASIPRSVPTKKTSCPRRLNSRATASPGMTCPPVPTPATMNVLALPGMLAYIHQHSQQRKRTQQRTASVTDHRKRNTLRRHHPQNYAHIDERLHYDYYGDSQGQVPAELIVHAK